MVDGNWVLHKEHFREVLKKLARRGEVRNNFSHAYYFDNLYELVDVHE